MKVVQKTAILAGVRIGVSSDIDRQTSLSSIV